MIHADPWLTDSDHRLIETACSFPLLVEVAIDVIARNRKPKAGVMQVCGPMTSGGGKFEENTAKIAEVITKLRNEGLVVFNQIPFQRGILNFMTVEDYTRNPFHLLNGFYGQLFRGKHIQALAFLAGWTDSFGCRWEYEMGLTLEMDIRFLSD